MAGVQAASNAPKARKRVEADALSATLKRARDGSAFARCEECKSSVPVALIDMHSCSLEAKIKMNLESQIIEKPAEIKKKPAEKKKSPSNATSESEPKSRKKLKKSSDPSKAKRPLTAFFVFMAEFRKTYTEENPDSKKASEVGKFAGEKWKSMSEEEKKPYLEKAAALKAEYEKAMESDAVEDAVEDADVKESDQPEELCDADA